MSLQICLCYNELNACYDWGEIMASKIMLIAPNEEIYKIGMQVIQEEQLPADALIGNLSVGAQLAKASVEEGYEVLVSRGGTYLEIVNTIKRVPCVPIYVTTIDLMEAMKKAVVYSKRIGVVGYANTIYEASSLGDYLHYDVVEISVKDPALLKERLKTEALHGLKVIVGDTISVKTAREIGLKGILIESGKRAVYEALIRAMDLSRIRMKDALEQGRLITILNSVDEGIIATDHEGTVTHINPVALQIFDFTASDIIGNRIQEYLPDDRVKEEIVNISNKQYLYNAQQIVYEGSYEAGHVITLKALKSIQETETKVRKKLHKSGLIAKKAIKDILGDSSAIKKVKEEIIKISDSNATVLIQGRTGVGKEMIAQSIHNLSPRREGPFVGVNCAAFSESLLESELFGYVEGSFTDARKGGKEGLFELAHRGTIFLDEISEMSLSVQAKVLRVMQEREVMRLGDNRIMPVDIRILVATNESLWDAVGKKLFREDLYYRVNVLGLEVPDLAQRKSDIPLLAEHYLRKNASFLHIEPGCFEPLKRFHWPGNVRQLNNFVEQLIVFTTNNEITMRDVQKRLDKLMQQHNTSLSGLVHPKKRITDKIIEETLVNFNGNQTAAAEALGIDRSTLYRRLKKMETKSNK